MRDLGFQDCGVSGCIRLWGRGMLRDQGRESKYVVFVMIMIRTNSILKMLTCSYSDKDNNNDCCYC